MRRTILAAIGRLLLKSAVVSVFALFILHSLFFADHIGARSRPRLNVCLTLNWNLHLLVMETNNYFLSEDDPEKWSLAEAFSLLEKKKPAESYRNCLRVLKDNLTEVLRKGSEKQVARAIKILGDWKVGFQTFFIHQLNF